MLLLTSVRYVNVLRPFIVELISKLDLRVAEENTLTKKILRNELNRNKRLFFF